MDWGIGKLHPIVLLLYSAIWLGAMFFYAQSWYSLFFLVANLLWYSWRLGRQGLSMVKWYGLLAGTTVLFHLLFYHRGRHILWYWFDQPVTLESLAYGLSMGALLFSLLLFWQIIGQVFSRQKWIYLWRPVLPQTTMVFLFSGGLFALCRQKMMEKWRVLWQGSQEEVPEGTKLSWRKRCKLVGDSLYAFSAWSIQWGMETVDSINSRGFGVAQGGKGKMPFPWRARDGFACGYLLFLWMILVFSGAKDWLSPAIGHMGFIGGLLVFIAYWEGKEGRLWRQY